MKKILHLVLSLTIISAICAAVLAYVNDVTKNIIANIATLKANAAANAVLPSGVKAIDTREDPADNTVKIFVGYADAEKKTVAGYAVPGHSGAGYGGDIRLMVGLTPDRTIVSYQVLAANETPGLGAKLGDKGFAGQFPGKAAEGLKVKKDGGAIEAITGATITSRAVCGAIADACSRVDRLEGKATAASAEPAVNPEGKLLFNPADSQEALKVLPKGTATATPLTEDRFPIFAGKDAQGAITGYAVTGTGKAQGPHGELLLHHLFGFKPNGTLSFNPPPRMVNQPGVEITDMEAAQRTAYTSAMKDAETRLQALLKK